MKSPKIIIAASLIVVAAAGASTAETLPQSSAQFPKPDRPVASVVSPTWGDSTTRTKANEVGQLRAALRLRIGTTVADIGSGDGYDSLRLAKFVGPKGKVIAEDITRPYLEALAKKAAQQRLTNIRIVVGKPDDPALAPASIDAAIMVHMYHEIASPYALLYRLAGAFRPGGRLAIEELDRPTQNHGTPPKLLTCELAAVGYRQVTMHPLRDDLGYVAVFAPPTAARLPAPGTIKACKS